MTRMISGESSVGRRTVFMWESSIHKNLTTSSSLIFVFHPDGRSEGQELPQRFQTAGETEETAICGFWRRRRQGKHASRDTRVCFNEPDDGGEAKKYEYEFVKCRDHTCIKGFVYLCAEISMPFDIFANRNLFRVSNFALDELESWNLNARIIFLSYISCGFVSIIFLPIIVVQSY